jgi:hypothetical protein
MASDVQAGRHEMMPPEPHWREIAAHFSIWHLKTQRQQGHAGDD